MSVEIITKNDLATFKEELLTDIKSIFTQPLPGRKEWLKSEDVREMLDISPGSLQNLRVKRILPFTKLAGTIYYSYEDVINALNANKRNGK